jgi:DNA-binding beta-propeller fold protein YncE
MKPLDKALMAAAGNVGEAAPPSNAWDIAYAEAPRDTTNAWDISKATNSDVVSGNFGGNSQGLVFKPDGTKMFITGSGADNVKEYSLTEAWNPSTSTLDYSFSISAQEATASGLFFKPDGTKFYVVGYTGDAVYEYDMTTAWDVSTASYSQSFSVSSQETGPRGIFFKPDGTKLYVTGSTGDDVNEYDLSTAWDISTASYSQNFSVGAQETLPQDVQFKSDGTKMYIMGSSGDDINEYNLSTAWDISTASYSQNFSVAAQDGFPSSLFWRPDGTQFFMIGYSNDNINVYTVDTYIFSVRTQDGLPLGVSFKDDGTKMYICGDAGNDINEYSLTTAWDIRTASYVTNFSVSSQSTNPQDIAWKADGTSFYIVSIAPSVAVYQYNLTTAWDISTASYANKSFTGLQENQPQGIYFKSDGLKMYTVGSASDSINEFTLTTAWDVSTASYDQEFSISSQDITPSGLFFKSDGTKAYIIGYNQDNLSEYDLTTAWDVSTASYSQNRDISGIDTIPRGLFFRPDGTSLFIVGTANDTVVRWDMT